MNLMGIPEVLLVIKVPGVLYLSNFSNTCFFISNRSTTTSIIQSTDPTFSISSSKLPVVILLANFLWYRGAGFDLIDAANASFTSRFLTTLSWSVSPFASSFSVSEKGTMSSNKTSTPIFAKWQAIPLPIIPEPITATLLILLLDI